MFSLLGKFLRRSPGDQWLFGRTWLLLLCTRASLVVLPFARVRKVFQQRGEPRERLVERCAGAVPQTRDRLAWAVRSAGRLVPSSKPCLTQALVLDLYLRRRGIPSRIAIGVERDGASIAAHAWVESGGRVVLGGQDLDRYTELRPSGEETPLL